MNNESLTIITCSYGPDAQRCRRLCRSIDRYVTDNIEHWLIVPRRDAALFRDLHGGRRRVCFTEDVVPGHFRQLPLTNKMWLSPKGWPVRGWIMQQVTKLSVNYAVDTELLLFCDSDLEFIRPLDLELLVQQERLRLHRLCDEDLSASRPSVPKSWANRGCSICLTCGTRTRTRPGPAGSRRPVSPEPSGKDDRISTPTTTRAYGIGLIG